MSKTWYPVINKEKCTKCLICARFCRNGVYEIKNGEPHVIQPYNCVHGCHGCGNKCPVGAIEYVGDIGKDNKNIGGCSCGGKC